MCKPTPTHCKHCTHTECTSIEEARKMMCRLGVPDFFTIMEQTATISSATTARGSSNEC